MKQRFLVVYEYGQGALWAFIHADSRSVIEERFPELKLVHDRAAWMTDEIVARLEATETYDLTEPPSGLLLDLLRSRERGR